MSADKKRLYIVAVSIFCLLFSALFIPNVSGRMIAALLLAIGGIASVFLLKKRSILSINKSQVLLLMAVIGVLYIVLYYVTGLRFGYYRAYGALSWETFTAYILPAGAIVVFSEMLRSVFLAQKDKWASVFAFLICVIGEVLVFSNLRGIETFNRFMDALGLYFLPAITGNILYHYLSKRYGAYPNLAYRLLVTLFPYIITIASGIPDSLYSFAKLILPLLIYWFIDLLYEKKRQRALAKPSKWSYVGVGVFALILVGYVMLISCQFTYGAFVVGSDSMTGELNKGDTVIYKEYDEEIIEIGQIIVFTKNGSKVIHRVVDVERINGVNRYITKGDANEDVDSGYITQSQIVGLAEFKIPYVGYPTLWIRSLF